MEINRILVIGNGFDLAHYLRTSYSNFLNFCKFITCKPFCNVKPNNYSQNLSEDQISFLQKLIKDNKLFMYLLKKSNNNNWCGFEIELYNIVSNLHCLEKEFSNSNVSSIKLPIDHIATKTLIDLKFASIIGKNEISTKTFIEIKNKISEDFNRITKALEMYIELIINKKPLQYFLPDVVRFAPNYVISFNYSDTFERHYLSKFNNVDIHYIHGKAKVSSKSNDNYVNIVLGITSNFNSETFISFEKYYQRIVKRTGNKYKKWINTNAKNEVMFFGHSLDSMDKDIIIDLVENIKTTVLIYYFDEKSKEGIVKNLSKIFGKEKLIDFVYGDYPKIKLIKQKESCKINQGEWKITKDLSCLNSLHLLKLNDIENIINRIKTNFNKHKYSYFYSQENAIKLYIALLKNDFYILESENIREICKHLRYTVIDGNLINHRNIERDNLFPNENKKTQHKNTLLINNLINDINTDNCIRYMQNNKSSMYYKIKNLYMETDKVNALKKILSKPDFFNKYEKALISEFDKHENLIYNTLITIKKDNNDIVSKIRATQVLNDYNNMNNDIIK